MPERFIGTLVGKEGRGPGVGSVVLRSPGSHRKKQFPFLECMWEWWMASLGGKKNWRHQCASLFTSMGIQTLAEGSTP